MELITFNHKKPRKFYVIHKVHEVLKAFAPSHPSKGKSRWDLHTPCKFFSDLNFLCVKGSRGIRNPAVVDDVNTQQW